MQVLALDADFRNGVGQRERRTVDFKFTVAVFEPPSPQYWVRVESDRWHTGGGSIALLSVASMRLPKEEKFKSNLSSVNPAAVSSILAKAEAAWFQKQFSHFTPAQMAALQVTRNSDENVLVSAPSGCGKMAIAELAVLRAFSTRRKDGIVFMTPDEGALEVMMKSWSKLSVFGQGNIIVLNPENICTLAASSLGWFSIILTTPSIWIEFMR